jgi:hypothetical protein
MTPHQAQNGWLSGKLVSRVEGVSPERHYGVSPLLSESDG